MQPFARGAVVARALAGSWRVEPDPVALSEEELTQAVPPLLKTGCSALAWRSVRHSPLAGSPSARLLHDGSRLHRIQLAVREQELEAVVAAFSRVEVHPLLVKGWSVARYYPERGLRPYGDLDFYLLGEEVERANAALATLPPATCQIELHRKHNFPFDRTIEELFRGAENVTLGSQQLRIPCAEDHLRLLCLHLLGHGVWRPLWLCDVAAMLERLPPEYDWDRCLSGRARYTEWMRCCFALAEELLGARVSSEAYAAGVRPILPKWLTMAVLKQWGLGSGTSQHQPLSTVLPLAWRHPQLLWREMAVHWQNPIEATVELERPFDDRPRLPLQLAAAVRRLPRLARELRGSSQPL